MSTCDLFIKLDDPEQRYTPGDRITGEVTVEVRQEVETRGLDVALFWRTHGKGNRASETVARATLFQGVLLAGVSATHRFELIAPPGPYTYHGHYLNVDWYLKATADIPWKLDPKMETELLLVPGARHPEDYRAGTEQTQAPTGLTNKLGEGCGLAFAGLVAMVGLGSWLYVLLAGASTTDEIGFAVFGSLALLMAAFVALMAVKNRLAQRKLGPVTVDVEPRLLRPGDALEVKVGFQPTAPLTLNRVTATLTGRERVVRGGGSNRTTHVHQIYEDTQTLVESTRVPAHQEQCLNARFQVPTDAPLSFHASDNDLNWAVAVHIDIPRWPDYQERAPLIVRP